MTMVTANDLAKLILQMNYGHLKAVALELSGAAADKESRPKVETPEEFADLLFDWAEGNSGFDEGSSGDD